MPHYQSLGKFPHKRHTQFRKPDGSLYSEQLFSTEGFSNDYSILYHCSPPTQIIKTEAQISVAPTIAEEKCEVSQKPNIEDKTIQELLEMDPDMFPVIIVNPFLFHFFNS